jgi:hypothetical protein
MVGNLNRRTLLQLGAAIAGGHLVSTEADTDGDDQAEMSAAGIPAPFDAIPTIDDPVDLDRKIARNYFPPECVPDEGPIPDYQHQHQEEHEITVPEWGVEGARWQLQRRLDCDVEESADTPDELPRWRIEEALMGYAQLRERYRTPDGRDAVDAIRTNLDEREGEDDS